MDGDDHQILRINGVMPWFLFGFTPCLIPVLAIKVFTLYAYDPPNHFVLSFDYIVG